MWGWKRRGGHTSNATNPRFHNWNRISAPDYLRRLFKCWSHSRPHDRQCPPTRAACAGAWNGKHGLATGGAAAVRYSALWNTQPNSHMSGEEAAEYRRPSESREAQLHQVHNPHSILRMKPDLSATYCKTDEESQSDWMLLLSQCCNRLSLPTGTQVSEGRERGISKKEGL